MSELYLLRHAKAVPPDASASDGDRALDERGRDGARAMAQWIGQQRLQPDLVLCSTAARTRETLELIVDAFGRRPDIRFESGIYLASADRLMARLRELTEKTATLMMIGHNPGLHELAQSLADVTTGPLASRLATNLPTAGLVRFEVPVEWSGLRKRCARLVAFITPKDLLVEE
jgi:phosphohistidine phosphatase